MIDNEIFIYSKVKRIPKIYKIADDIYSFCPQGTRDEFQSAILYLFETRQNCIENPAKMSDNYVGDKIVNDFFVVNIVSPTPI